MYFKIYVQPLLDDFNEQSQYDAKMRMHADDCVGKARGKDMIARAIEKVKAYGEEYFVYINPQKCNLVRMALTKAKRP